MALKRRDCDVNCSFLGTLCPHKFVKPFLEESATTVSATTVTAIVIYKKVCEEATINFSSGLYRKAHSYWYSETEKRQNFCWPSTVSYSRLFIHLCGPVWMIPNTANKGKLWFRIFPVPRDVVRLTTLANRYWN